MPRSLLPISILTLQTLTAVATAQPLDMRIPIAGFVYFGGSRSVRPMWGVSGAATVGLPVLTDVDSASIAPNGRWALLTAAGQSQLVRGLSEAAPVVTTAPDLIAGIDRVVWNRSGAVAVLYSSAAAQLQRVQFSESAVRTDPPIAVSGGPLSAVAIDAGGSRIAFGVAGGGLFLWSTSQPSPVLLPGIGPGGPVAFDESGTLYAVDAAAQRILRFDAASGAAEVASLADPSGLLLNPVGLTVSAGGRYLLVADAPTSAVRVYETASGNLTKIMPLSFAPSRFEPLSQDPSFILNDPGPNEWLLILNAGDSPSVSFVPARQEDAQ